MRPNISTYTSPGCPAKAAHDHCPNQVAHSSRPLPTSGYWRTVKQDHTKTVPSTLNSPKSAYVCVAGKLGRSYGRKKTGWRYAKKKVQRINLGGKNRKRQSEWKKATMDRHHLSLHFGNFYSGFRVRRRISYHISIFYFICSRQIFVNENFILRSPRHPPPSPAHRCAFNVELHPPARLPFSFIHFGERKVDGDFTLCRFTDFFLLCDIAVYHSAQWEKKMPEKQKSTRCSFWCHGMRPPKTVGHRNRFCLSIVWARFNYLLMHFWATGVALY